VEKEKNHDKSFLIKTGNLIISKFIISISHLPFWMLYGFSDFLFVILRYVVKYRLKLTTENLTYAFPHKTEKEIAKIRTKFYRHLCDLIVEGVKMYSMSPKQMDKHISFKGLELADKFVKEKKNIIILATHHNNWEWCSFSQTKLEHLILMVYSPMRGNAHVDKFLLNAREKWGGECVPMAKTRRTMMSHKLKGRLTGLWLAADQTALASSKFWTVFLNREAPFYSGPAKIAINTNQPVFFQHVKKIKRGKYIAEYSLLFEEPAKLNEKDILLGYINKMEEIIHKEPEYYLWSHRRWKHVRPKNISLIN
jgi:KDO2-lipid IV(A) lauroyltransferase